MTLLHRLLFKRPGTAHEIKKNIREFSGFSFIKTDKEFDSRKHTLAKYEMFHSFSCFNFYQLDSFLIDTGMLWLISNSSVNCCA